MGLRLRGYNANEINELIKSTYTDTDDTIYSFLKQSQEELWKDRLRAAPLYLLEASEDSRRFPASSVRYSLEGDSSFLVTPRPIDINFDPSSCHSFAYELRKEQDLSTILSLKLPDGAEEDATLCAYESALGWVELKSRVPPSRIETLPKNKQILVPSYSTGDTQVYTCDRTSEERGGKTSIVLVEGLPNIVCRLRLEEDTLHIEVREGDGGWKEEASVTSASIYRLEKSIVFSRQENKGFGIFLVERRSNNRWVYFVDVSAEEKGLTEIFEHRKRDSEVVWSAHTNPSRKKTFLFCLDKEDLYLATWDSQTKKLTDFSCSYGFTLLQDEDTPTVVHLTQDAQGRLYLCVGSSFGYIVTGLLFFDDKKLTFEPTSHFKAHEAPVAAIFVQHKKEKPPNLWTTALDGSIFRYSGEGTGQIQLQEPAEAKVREEQNLDFFPSVEAAKNSGASAVFLEIPYNLEDKVKKKLIDKFEFTFGNVQQVQQLNSESLASSDALLRPWLYDFDLGEPVVQTMFWGVEYTKQDCKIIRKEDKEVVAEISIQKSDSSKWNWHGFGQDQRIRKTFAVLWFSQNVDLQIMYPDDTTAEAHLQIYLFSSAQIKSLEQVFKTLERNLFTFWEQETTPPFVVEVKNNELTDLSKTSFERMISPYFRSLLRKQD